MKMSDTSFASDNILINFPSSIQKNIEELCLRSKIGLSSISLDDISISRNNSIAHCEILENYHFVLKVPFAGRKLKWEVIFDPEDLYFTPDFYFNDDCFLVSPQIDVLLENVPTLENWDLRNPLALSKVLNEFLGFFKKLQIEKLRSEKMYAYYREEYEALITEENGIGAENVEVYVGNHIDFLLSLPVDCSSLPPYAQPMNCPNDEGYNIRHDFAHLKISILELDGSRTSVSLQLSPRLGQVLGAKSITMPSYENMTLSTYRAAVSKILDSRIAAVVDHYVRKKVYVVNLVAMCCKSIVEYDSEGFSKAVFLFPVDDYDCLVTVTLGPRFPQEKPSVYLSSIYCQESRYCNEIIDTYPYQVRHKPEVNVEHLLEYLGDVIRKFRSHKHT